MKIRESGMPEPNVWETFFNPEAILAALGFTPENRQVVEFGCGYGTFTIPAALILASLTRPSGADQLGIAQSNVVPGHLTAFDIDPKMLEVTRSRALRSKVNNVQALAVDFDQVETPLTSGSIDYVMLFNILHGENPFALLAEAYRLLRPGAAGGLIHWNYDPETPRGPPMDIRPKPIELAKLTRDAGFHISAKIDLPPYHYGFRFEKPALG